MFDSVRRFTASLFGSPKPAEEETPARNRSSSQGARFHPEFREARARVVSEADIELEQLRQKLAQISTSIDHEQDYSRKSGSSSNRGLIEVLERRAAHIKDKMNRLGREIALLRPARRRVIPPNGRPKPVASAAPGRAEPVGNGHSLTQAARLALRKGRFESSSERAIFAKLADDMAEGGPEIHLQVLDRLSELKFVAALPVLRTAARHESEEVRVAAIRAAMALRHPSTRDLLLGALEDPSHRVRVWALRGLYGLNDAGLPELLCQSLIDPHPQVRRAAVTYLSWKRIGEAERMLLDALGDSATSVRVAAVTALGQCGSHTSVFRLLGVLKQEDPELREAALAVLQKLQEQLPQFDPGGSRDDRFRRVAELKIWWETERVRQLVDSGPAAGVESAAQSSPMPTSDADSLEGSTNDAEVGDFAPDETASESDAADEFGSASEPPEEFSEAAGLEDEGDLDAEPDIGSELDGDDSFDTVGTPQESNE